jgi:AcrR family transcriptional regulator
MAGLSESQRRRLLAGIAKALVEEGYARLTVEHVIANAGVSRKTFYEYFENWEECLLAAYDAVSEGRQPRSPRLPRSPV